MWAQAVSIGHDDVKDYTNQSKQVKLNYFTSIRFEAELKEIIFELKRTKNLRKSSDSNYDLKNNTLFSLTTIDPCNSRDGLTTET